MDMKKLCDLLTSNEDLRDIPITYVFRVACAVFELINEGDCFKDKTESDVYVSEV